MNPDPSRARPDKSLRVLIVDDNKDLADSLGTLLGLWGYDRRVAYDGRSGLEAAHSYHPDCILVDITMPIMDGYAVAREIRRDPGLGRAKLVAQTAYTEDDSDGHFRAMGFDDQLGKPTDLARLRQLLEGLAHARGEDGPMVGRRGPLRPEEARAPL